MGHVNWNNMEVSNLRNKRGQIDGKKAIVYVRKRLEEGAMCKTIAEEMGVPQKTLAGMMSWWRSKGEEVPNMHFVAPEGHIRIRIQHGIRYREVKTGDKWKPIGRVENQPYKQAAREKAVTGYITKTKEGKTAKKKVTVVTQKTKKVVKMPKLKEPKKEPEKLQTKVVDPIKVKTVRVSKTTYIQVDIDTPDEVAIQRWKDKYEQNN